VSADPETDPGRRLFLLAGLAAVVAACGEGEYGDPLVTAPPSTRQRSGPGPRQGRLSFRRSPPARGLGASGTMTIQGTGKAPPAMAYVPDLDHDDRPMRLVVLLHGAGGEAERSVKWLRPFADTGRLMLLAPKSTQGTWDVIRGGYGPDVRNLDRLLRKVAADYPIDSYAVAGFSDGASYSLSLGLGNGDVFDSVIAFSPGFSAAQLRVGRPRFFISHGTLDSVLPIDRCSRRLVPALEENGYDVVYREFTGGHEVPSQIMESAVDWLTSAA
jgi:predicted esterase